MECKIINISIPQDVLFEINSLPLNGMNLEQKIKLNLAFGMYVSKDVSLAKASQIAGIPIAEFIHLLNSINIPVFEYTDERLSDDLEFIKTYESKTNTQV